MQGCEQFGIGGGESSRESSVGRSERCHRGAITGSGRVQVGSDVNSVLLIGVISGLKSCDGFGYRRIAPFLIGPGEEGFKARPVLESRGLALPDFTVVEKQPCLKNELESDAYDLLRRVGPVAGFRIFDGSFYLIDDCFDGVVGVVGGA